MANILDGFRVGDRVTVTGSYYGNQSVGESGTILLLTPIAKSVGKPSSTKTGASRSWAHVSMDSGRTWYIALSDLVLIDEEADEAEVQAAIASILKSEDS